MPKSIVWHTMHNLTICYLGVKMHHKALFDIIDVMSFIKIKNKLCTSWASWTEKIGKKLWYYEANASSGCSWAWTSIPVKLLTFDSNNLNICSSNNCQVIVIKMIIIMIQPFECQVPSTRASTKVIGSSSLFVSNLLSKMPFFKLTLGQFWVAQFTQIALNIILIKWSWKLITPLPTNLPKSAILS